MLTTLNKTNAALSHMESGKGVAGKLIYDDKYAEQLTDVAHRRARNRCRRSSATCRTSFESGNGLLPALLHDPEGKKKVYDLVDNLQHDFGEPGRRSAQRCRTARVSCRA